MAVYLITYDLNREVVRPPIVAKVEEFTYWARLSESSYAISTNLSVEEVYAHFKPLTDDDDSLYVITLGAPWTGRGEKAVIDWLTTSLGS